MHPTFPHFENYVWKNGIPRGKNVINDVSIAPLSYRIICDPYYKRITIELHQNGMWQDVVYDSSLFDFRIIRQSNHEKGIQEEWERIPMCPQDLSSKNTLESMFLIRNREDRPIYIEKMAFENMRPKKCFIYSPQRQLLATHALFYEDIGDDFNGVIVYDTLDKIVVKKVYEYDREEGQFTTLLSESW